MIIFIILFIIIPFFVIHSQLRRARIYRELLESVTNEYRGTKSERDLIVDLLENEISPKAIFHDLYVRKNNGDFSQIDLVIATKVGIIVLEVKDYSGWIFGNGKQDKWTQVLAYGRDKYRFYNPVMQNHGHINALRKTLKQFENIPFYSVIVFDGDCSLRDISLIPENTFITKSDRVVEVINHIINSSNPAEYTDKKEIIYVLKQSVENGDNQEIISKHVENIINTVGKHRVFD